MPGHRHGRGRRAARSGAQAARPPPARGAAGSPAGVISARPPSAPARSSSSAAARRSATTAAPRRPSSAAATASSNPGSTSSSSASDDAPPGAGACARRNWLAAASSPPIRAASRRAASTSRSPPRSAVRACSTRSSAASRARSAPVTASVRATARSAAPARWASSSASCRVSSASRSRSSAAMRSFERLDPSGRGLVGDIGRRLGEQCLQRLRGVSAAALQRGGVAAHGLRPVLDALGRRLGGVAAARELLALGAALGKRLLGAHRAACRPPVGGPPPARGGRAPRRRPPVPGRATACGRERHRGQLPARLERLALEPGVELGRLGLSLERPQPRTRLALDVERTVEVVLGAGELQLRAAPALAVLAEPGGLLDQQPPVARLGGDDRLDPALGDDRVHLLAQAGVGQELDHVDQPAARAGQAVLALAAAVQPALDRDLGGPEPEHAGTVVEHELDLGRLAGLAPGRPAEDDVLHRLAADGHRRLLAERPQNCVGDVRLARAIGADDHADARPELEPRAVGERLEALEGDRLQVHARASRGLGGAATRGRALRARPARPPARRPSCCGPCPARPRRR